MQKGAGADPAQAKRIAKINMAAADANTFEAVAREWHTNTLDTWQPRTAANILRRLEVDIFPLIGRHPIAQIKVPLMLDVLRKIEKRGALDMAKRQGQVCGRVFRYAIASSLLAKRNQIRCPACAARSSRLRAVTTPPSPWTSCLNFFVLLRRVRGACFCRPGS